VPHRFTALPLRDSRITPFTLRGTLSHEATKRFVTEITQGMLAGRYCRLSVTGVTLRVRKGASRRRSDKRDPGLRWR
jgi:hypothetical protein